MQICLIQEPWFLKGQVKGIKYVDNLLVYHRSGSRPRAAIFMRGVQGNVIPSFITGDLFAGQIKCGESKDQKDMVVCLAYFPSYSEAMPPSTKFKELIEYCSEKKHP